MWRTLMICAALAIAGCASAPAPRTDVANVPAGDAGCVRQDSLLTQNKCVAGRSFTQQQIQSTGQTNGGDALHLLDPSITVHHE
jgi:hypothetical protein